VILCGYGREWLCYCDNVCGVDAVVVWQTLEQGMRLCGDSSDDDAEMRIIYYHKYIGRGAKYFKA
jgi:hypothetical protein